MNVLTKPHTHHPPSFVYHKSLLLILFSTKVWCKTMPYLPINQQSKNVFLRKQVKKMGFNVFSFLLAEIITRKHKSVTQNNNESVGRAMWSETRVTAISV